MKRVIRLGLEKLLERFEYRLVDARSAPAGFPEVCGQLKGMGVSPATVIDVGVGPGTSWLYEAFPQARFELFEPLDTFGPAIEKATRGLDTRVHWCALGAERSQQTIAVNVDAPTSSSMARYRSEYLDHDGLGLTQTRVDKAVPVCPLDDFGPFPGPVLLKLDVEGYEHQVLKGARRTLENVDAIISEVSVAPRTVDEISLPAYLCLLESMGFSMINIADIAPFGRGRPIAYMDLVFVRSDSALRYGRAH